MVLVRGGEYRFKVSGVEIEGGDGPGVNFQYPWEDFPRRRPTRRWTCSGSTSTNTRSPTPSSSDFIDASGYKPKDNITS